MPSTQTVEFRAVTGQTVTAKLFAAGSDTEVASVTATEQTNRKGTYRAAFTDVAEGEYQLLAFNATPIPLASWWVTLTLTTATFQVYDRVDTPGITRSNWAALTVDHTSTGSFGAALGALASSSGSGARTVTVTVNDGTTVLQNARVRMTEGANTYVALTNASGVVTFNLNDATYTVSITKDGYSYSGTTLVVDGNETVTYSMTAISITPSNPSLVTGYYTCYSELGVVESGVTVTLQVDRVPSETGLALDSAVRTATSDSNGLAQFTNLVPGAWYKVRRGEGNYYTFQISASATGSVELNSIIGT